MKLADVSISRPIFATMMISALVVLGLFSYGRLGVDLFPNIDLPIVTVSTTLRGASPEEIETSLTKQIEEAVNTISGIDELRSTSFEGLSQVIVTFVLEKDADVGAQEVRDAVGRVLADLPQGTDPPVIQKFDPGAAPVMSIAVSGALPLREITEIAKKRIKEPLETIKGVGKISMVGGREREVHAVVNPMKLAAFKLSIKQVKEALQQQNIEVPGGRVEQSRRELVLRTMGRIESPKEFERVVIANVNGVPVRVRDIGRVEDAEEEPRSLARLDGTSAVSLIVQKQSGMNTVEVIQRVKEDLADLKAALPPGVSAKVVRDQSEFILGSVHTVQEHLVLGAILASVVVLLFMGSFRSTLIAAVAIPTSLIATYILMDTAGFTLNNMTLLGLALAVGVVIDDAIVVLENIFRHMEEDGAPAMRAAGEATREIGTAVMATTLSLVIIFLPLAYMPGIVGRFLKEYGFTVAFAIMVSLFVAFTLTPMLCSRFLKIQHGPKNKLQLWVDRLNDYLKERYGRMVEWSMRRRRLMVAATILTILSTGVIIRFVGKDFIPPDDAGEFQITIKSPEGTSIKAMDLILKQIEAEVNRLPDVESLLASIGEGEGASVNDGLVYVRLAPLGKRKANQFVVMALARKALAKYEGLRIGVTPIAAISGGGFKSSDFNYVISGPDLDRLRDYSAAIVERLKKAPGIVDVDTSLTYAKPELRVRIDRDRAQDLGVKIEDIANSLRTMVGGEEDITKYKEGDDLYQVRLRVDKNYRDRPDVISGLYVPSSKVGLVRLDSVATLVEARGPSQIDRVNRQRSVTITANLQGAPIGYAIDKANEVVKELNLPPDYKTGLLGKAKEFGRMMKGFLVAFGLSFIFMYMVLASQFESFVHPVTIMMTLPLSIPFALISLLVMGQNLTIFSIMGIFMLFGIVKKNAILQVDYTNTLRERGMERDKAILEANKTRLRPILMTTIVLVAAMLPVAFGGGPGAANRATMAVVIVGGQSLCLLITLLVVPVFYSLFDDATQWVKARMGGDS
ncbi:MAG: efflux RND transporter permease subunit [Elusimicrobia bacterium]|nr:efflux RND transporter permease subunit [Elusimicrobiota bacterium]MBK7545662.1 efflux RND transporter permease subunit [Elusimicrobiota bacterium]MBK7574924.1 efflux RND transporter permease subunit [Elusimicrobiota bacterium]MBK7687423.1 efflux RND transporter permease subunit [Elusimicrobiota bacterium]MBK8125663.1 efflux RND transporter permease subunit [Elusimicrobiota bacterium]